MPQVVAWAATSVNGWAYAAGYQTLTNVSYWVAANSTLVAGAITVAASVAYSSAQQRKLKKALQSGASQLDQGRSTMLRDPLAPRRIIYGQCQVGGTITFFHQANPTGFHYMVVTLATHECEEIGDIKIDNQAATLDGTGLVNSGPFAGVVQIRKFLGLAAGERDTTWESEIPDHWTENHLGKGIARLHVRLKWDADRFPGGIPTITCLVKGAKVYDPRDEGQSPTDPSTWLYSNNAALCSAHFLNVRKGISYSRIVESALITAANVCDEEVVLAT